MARKAETSVCAGARSEKSEYKRARTARNSPKAHGLTAKYEQQPVLQSLPASQSTELTGDVQAQLTLLRHQRMTQINQSFGCAPPQLPNTLTMGGYPAAFAQATPMATAAMPSSDALFGPLARRPR